MKLNGFSILRIRGIEIIIDYSWFVIFFLVAYSAQSYFPKIHPNYSSPQYWIMGIVTALLLFLSILVHELAHSFIAIKYGIKVISIRLFVFGGLAQATSEPKNAKHEFLIALSGPATSLAIGLFLGGVYLLASISMTPVAGVAMCLALANIILAFINLIPGFPLDGGRILRALLWDHWNDRTRATKVVSQFGNGFALFLILLGILLFWETQSLIVGLLFVLMGLFMKQSAFGSYQSVMLQQILVGVQVQQIMAEKMVAVDWLAPIDQLIRDYFYKHQFTSFPVFNRDEFIGMVSLEGVKTISKELWGFKQVRDIMTSIDLVPCLKPTDDVSEALSRMADLNIDHMPVAENGRFMGMVTHHDIMNLVKIKSDLDGA
jgi:Zn-dependent protease/CBS domain-containing protein